MNILFITTTLPRYANDGQAPFVLEQAQAWKRSYPDDRVLVLAPHDAGAQLSELSEGVVLNRFRYWWPTKWQRVAYQAILPNLRKKPWLAAQVPALLIFEFAAARRLIRKHDIDFVFAHCAPAQEMLAHMRQGGHTAEYVLMALSVGVAAAGIALARRWYLTRRDIPDSLAARLPRLYSLLVNKYYVDEAYGAAVVTPLMKGSDRLLWKGVDVGVIDWTVNAIGRAFDALGRTARLIQTGVNETYVFVFLIGVVAIIGWLLLS